MRRVPASKRRVIADLIGLQYDLGTNTCKDFGSFVSQPQHAVSGASWKQARCQLAAIAALTLAAPLRGMVVVQKAEDEPKERPFKPCGGIKDRLSMWSVNPYQYDARPPPDLDFTLFD